MTEKLHFCSAEDAKCVPEGERAGSTWSSAELVELHNRIANGHSLITISKALRRSSWGIICKAVDKRYIYASGNHYYSSLFTATTKTSPEKETEMTTEKTVQADPSHPVIEAKVFIQGHDASSISDEQIFSLIAALEARIVAANAIINKPKRLQDLIKKTQDDIDALVSYVDGRE